MHDWTLATYDQKVDSDANYIRCLRYALRPEHTAAVRIGVAGHNLFDIAYAWLLADRARCRERARRMSSSRCCSAWRRARSQAVAREVGHVLLYVPVVRPDEFDVAISYLVRRLEENASSENFLSAAFDLADDPAMFERERDRFVASLARADDPELATGPNRTQDRGAERRAHRGRGTPRPCSRAAMRRPPPTSRSHQAVIGSPDRPCPATPRRSTGPFRQVFGAEAFVETAVFEPRESGRGPPAPRFRNAADTDPALPANRELVARASSPASSRRPPATRRSTPRASTDEPVLEAIVARVRSAARRVGRPARRRSRRRAAARRGAGPRGAPRRAHRGRGLRDRQGLRRGGCRGQRGRRLRQLLRRHGARARQRQRGGLRAARADRRRPRRGTSRSRSPRAACSPRSPQGRASCSSPRPRRAAARPSWPRRCGRPASRAMCSPSSTSRRARSASALIAHPDVDRVILTGSWETAALFRSWRPDLPLLAETSGKNAMIVMPTADLDLAAADLIKSAFGHAGQKCSAASLAILVGPVGHSQAVRASARGCDAIAARRAAERPAVGGRAAHRGAAAASSRGR